MSETHDPPDLSAANAATDLPPLRIHHLMIWMAVTAVLISACISVDRVVRNGPPITDPLDAISLIFLAIGVSGALCCVGWGFYWRSQGRAFPVEPGQWLLVEIAAIVCGLLTWVAGSFVFLWIEEDLIQTFQFAWGVLLGVSLVSLNIFVGLKRCDTRAWQIAILSLVAIPIIAPFAVTWAVWNDRRRRIPRHWTHWFGVSFLVIWMLFWSAIVIRDEYF